MAINPLYIPLFTIEEVILDKDSGLPLAGGIVTFYRDSQRLTPKPVYQISGASPNYTFTSVGNQLTLGIAGDFVDNNGNPFVPYAYPYDDDGNIDLYYVTVVSAGLVAQFVRQAVPYIATNNINPADLANDGNQLSNPQFVESLFPRVGSSTIAVTGSGTVTPIAPGWDLVTTGSGNVVLQILQPTASNVPTNPPYALSITADAALGATITLRQRLLNSPSIYRGGFASAMFAAAVISGGGSAIGLTYAPSLGTSTTLIPNTSIPTDGAYHVIQGNAAITVQNNDPADSGYIDVLITIPTARTIAITSVQLVGLSFAANVDFEEQTSARQKDHLFHYYEKSLVTESKNSMLTGWNFGLNPWQYSAAAGFSVPVNQYTADQTIVIQQNYVSNIANTNNIFVAREIAAGNNSFHVEPITAHNQFAILQYIDPSTVRQFWGSVVSSMVIIQVNNVQMPATAIRFKARLIYKAGLPGTTSQTVPIASWTEGADPVAASGYTLIAPPLDPIYTMTPNKQSFSFNGFQLPASTDNNMTLGLLIYTIDNMVSGASHDFLNFYDVSLVQNDFALPTQPETYDQTLSKCQFYYEKSYQGDNLGGTITTQGQRYAPAPYFVSAGVAALPRRTFELIYNTIKRANAIVTFYDPSSATPNQVQLQLSGASPASIATSTYAPIASVKNLFMPPNVLTTALTVNPAVVGTEGLTVYHFTADSRLGI